MLNTLIIGYGNPLREDDGIGWATIRELQKILPHKSIQFLTEHQLTPELAEKISHTDLVILIDAHVGDKTGTWKSTQVKIDSAKTAQPLLSHHVTPESLLFASHALYGHAPMAWVYSMESHHFDVREGLSDSVQKALPQFVKAISDFILQ